MGRRLGPWLPHFRLFFFAVQLSGGKHLYTGQIRIDIFKILLREGGEKIAMDKAKRAVGYIRVSDPSQAEPDKASLPEQERGIREYCQRKGYELLEIFSDVGWGCFTP